MLLPNNQPAAFASKPLTEMQKKYAQIEKEMLGKVFGCTKFHDFIFGKTMSVETGHKPIEAIYKKPLYLAPVRLQRMIMKLQRYDLRVQYKKGSELYFADTLSRAHLPDTSKNVDEDFEISMVLVVSEQKLTQRRNQHSLAFQIPSASKDVYQYSFFPQTIRDWNDLPESLISSSEMSDDSVSKFTSLVRARD